MNIYRSQVLVCGGTGCTSSGSALLIDEFEKQLKEALKTEDYEMAAVCRDKIRALKAGKDGQVHE